MRHYNRPDRLFFFSSHLYDKEGSFEFFPGSGAGDDTACNIINVPIQPMWTTKTGSTPGTTTRSRSTVAMHHATYFLLFIVAYFTLDTEPY